MNIDLYELNYRSYKVFENRKPDTNISVTKETKRSVMKIIDDFHHVKAKIQDEICFSDVICNIQPVFDEKTHNLSYQYEFIFIDGSNKGNPVEIVERFKKLDINALPLIEVAKYLNIQVEKSNIIKPYRQFNPQENKITLGSDYAPSFIHELVHAIDHILGNSFDDYSEYENRCFDELIAELSAVVLCKTYNIPIDVSESKYYLDYYSNSEINVSKMINRVFLICEYINKCIENINNKKSPMAFSDRSICYE